MIIDCDRCTVRGDACRDCVVTFLLDPAPQAASFTRDERAAVAALASAGMVPPLRMAVGDLDP